MMIRLLVALSALIWTLPMTTAVGPRLTVAPPPTPPAATAPAPLTTPVPACWEGISCSTLARSSALACSQ